MVFLMNPIISNELNLFAQELQFLNMQLGPGKNNDKTYGTICLETVEADDLCLRDLG
ncbi:TPA: hypothetical protein ROX88_003374 [Bacillus pseudomycoides]|nr:hypothetical protein [Bacillus pseudomycoides]